MNKPSVITQIEQLLNITLFLAPIRRGKDLLSGVMPYKRDTPKYALEENQLVGLNLARTGLTDETWQKIIQLPEFFPKKIQALNLSDNELTEFQADWGFDNLTRLNLVDNPLIFPPEEITSQGNAAILNYLQELQEGDVVVYEAKLLIIGEAGVGKTTLACKIRDPESAMPQEVIDTTKGIEIAPYVIKEEGEPDFTIHIWDFGGQAIYHSTHQFFLSKRSLYVLVLDGRKEENPNYWLQIQDLLGEDSPVMLLLNKKGEIRTQVAFQELLGFYPNLQTPQHFFSLETDRDKLKTFTKQMAQQMRSLPQFVRGEKVPSKWKNIRTRLEEIAKNENYVSLDTFRKICIEEGIPEPKRQDFLSDFLHSLGVILHFSKEPLLSKMLILKPEWATNSVYKVLDHTREHARVQGHFYRHELDEIWSEGDYQGVFNEMLALMERFELCYSLPDSPDEFIVPQLLSPDKPSSYTWENKDQIQYHYSYTFMPKGIVTRLIVRLHKYIEDQSTVWQRGAVFNYQGSLAEVSEIFRDQKIQIKVQGVNRKALLSVILHQINEINDTFDFDERLKVTQLIPCNCIKCKAEETPYFFPNGVIDKAKVEGVSELQCQSSFKFVSILGLIEDTYTEAVMVYREKNKGESRLGGDIIIHGDVNNLHVDQRSVIQHLQPFQQLVEAEHQEGFITRDEYEDLMDILKEIEESPKPSPNQKRRWKRWVGKAVDKGREFTGKRLEKGADTVIGEEVKKWIKEDGLEKVLEMISNL